MQNYRNVVVPTINIINFENIQYEKEGGLGIVGFTWKLGQSPFSRPNGVNIPGSVGKLDKDRKQSIQPQSSPIMCGGLFGATKQFFVNELEGYDPEFEIYGGEEMEIGFKVWQCHGTIEAIPCSTVGHIFRGNKHWEGSVRLNSRGFMGIGLSES